jgi:hypothetical protein
MAGFDDPSLKDLNQRLLEIKRGPHYEEAKLTTPEELQIRLKQLKDLETVVPTDESLHERFKKITIEDGLEQKPESKEDDGIHHLDPEDVKSQQYLEQLQQEAKEKPIDDEDDDFELFLAEAGVSEKIIDRMMQFPLQDDVATLDETKIVRLESGFANSDAFADSFQSEFNLSSSHDPELSQLMNQAKDELRLLPTSTTFSYSLPPPALVTAELLDLQEIFDDSDEIQRLVTEAQELAALDRKYQAIEDAAASAAPQSQQKGPSTRPSTGGCGSGNVIKSSPAASLTHFEPNDYYYRRQAQNISHDLEREKKRKEEKKYKHSRRGRGGGSSSSDSDSSVDSDDSY